MRGDCLFQEVLAEVRDFITQLGYILYYVYTTQICSEKGGGQTIL